MGSLACTPIDHRGKPPKETLEYLVLKFGSVLMAYVAHALVKTKICGGGRALPYENLLLHALIFVFETKSIILQFSFCYQYAASGKSKILQNTSEYFVP